MSELGALRSRHRRTDGLFFRVFGTGLLLAAIVAAVIAWYTRPLDGSEVIVFVIAEGLMVPVGGLSLWHQWITRDDAIDVHEHGLAVHQNGYTRTIRWAEIKSKIRLDRDHVNLVLVDGTYVELTGSANDRSIDETLDDLLKNSSAASRV